jgi:peptidoglycan/LPS O-acetylase OafA/YrhL
MKTYTPVWGTNGPLWSLKYEWWFFMFYPIILFFRTKNILFALIMLLLFFILSLLQLFPIKLLNDIFYYMILWWLGSLLADVYIGNIKIKIKYLTILSMFIIVPLFFNKFYDYIVSLGLTGILALFLYLKQNNSSILNYLDKISFLGSFSYTLYIIHFPILVFLAGLILKYNDNQFSKSFHFIFIGIILSYILSYILSIFIEKPFISKYDTKN